MIPIQFSKQDGNTVLFTALQAKQKRRSRSPATQNR
jgi:hypothetical protein